MIKIEPSVKLETRQTQYEMLSIIEDAARTCYKSENNITDGSSMRMYKNLIKSGHTAMIEHVCITVRVICDRGVSHEIVRHRIGSYAQESTRYCNYASGKFGEQLTFIDIGTFIGTIGFFFVLFLLYSRTFPVIAQAEVKTILKGTGDNYKREREANKDTHHE